jgi:hypothetical protein
MLTTARTALPTALLLLVALTGCGGTADEARSSTLTDDEQTAADNLAAQITRSGEVSGSDNPVTDEEAACVAEGAVSEVGLDGLQGYGIVTEDLLVDKSIQGVEMEPDDAKALAGVFVECVDAEGLFEERFLASLSPAQADKARDCVEHAVDADTVRSILAASFEGHRSDSSSSLQKKVSACLGGKGQGQ